MVKAVICLSGGMDSATVLAEALNAKREVTAIGFTYGSKHNPYENEMAVRLSEHYRVPFSLIDLTQVTTHFRSNLLKQGGPIPEGHYQAESMSQTVVPARNIIFASILSGLAWSLDAAEVWMGIHAGDHAIYPDCRPEFFFAMQQAIELGTDERVTLVAPFLSETKATIVHRGIELKVPYNLTRTCYKDQPVACGKCGACQERLEAFQLNDEIDPIPYEAKDE